MAAEPKRARPWSWSPVGRARLSVQVLPAFSRGEQPGGSGGCGSGAVGQGRGSCTESQRERGGAAAARRPGTLRESWALAKARGDRVRCGAALCAPFRWSRTPLSLPASPASLQPLSQGPDSAPTPCLAPCGCSCTALAHSAPARPRERTRAMARGRGSAGSAPLKGLWHPVLACPARRCGNVRFPNTGVPLQFLAGGTVGGPPAFLVTPSSSQRKTERPSRGGSRLPAEGQIPGVASS